MANADLRQFSYHIGVTLPARFAARQRSAVLAAAEIGARRSAAAAPVDTGRLRASIHAREVGVGDAGARRGNVAAAFGSDVPYAGYQEFGTRRIAPRRYIQVGYERAVEYLESQGFKRESG